MIATLPFYPFLERGCRGGKDSFKTVLKSVFNYISDEWILIISKSIVFIEINYDRTSSWHLKAIWCTWGCIFVVKNIDYYSKKTRAWLG